MEIQTIIDELYSSREKLPEEALEAAIAKRDEITPALLKILEESIDRIEELAEDNSMEHLYAMLLLAQFREYKAYPMVVRFFSVPGEVAVDATGDMGLSYCHRILASVCHGDDTLIKQMAEDASVNEYLRASALKAMSCLVATGQASRESVLEYFGALLKRRFFEPVEDFPSFYTFLVSEITDLYPEELYGEIMDAFDRDMVDSSFIDRKFVDSFMARGKDVVLSRLKTNAGDYLDDVIGALRPWFRESEPMPASGKKEKDRREPQPSVLAFDGVEDILGKISNDFFPKKALEAAVDMEEEITPHLLQILEDAISNIDDLIGDEFYMGHVYAMLLLGQFREYKAYPLVVRFFSLPDDAAVAATDDFDTIFLHRVLASVCHGDDTLIKEMVENESLNESVRSAGLQALTSLVTTGQASRESAVEYLGALLRRQSPESAKAFQFFYTSIILALMHLYPEEFYDDIADAFNRDLVDLTLVDMDSVNTRMAMGKDNALAMLNLGRWGYLDDVIEELSEAFDDEDESFEDLQEEYEEMEELRRLLHKPAPFVREKKIGRNEPCPCGSGKKYKKCCGR